MKLKALQNRINAIKQELDGIATDCIKGNQPGAKHRVDSIEAKLNDLWKCIHKFQN